MPTMIASTYSNMAWRSPDWSFD